MRGLALLIGILGSLVGLVGEPGEAPEGSERRVRLPHVASSTHGYSARGPHYFVWEEDRGSAVGWAEELQRVDTPEPDRSST